MIQDKNKKLKKATTQVRTSWGWESTYWFLRASPTSFSGWFLKFRGCFSSFVKFLNVPERHAVSSTSGRARGTCVCTSERAGEARGGARADVLLQVTGSGTLVLVRSGDQTLPSF